MGHSDLKTLMSCGFLRFCISTVRKDYRFIGLGANSTKVIYISYMTGFSVLPDDEFRPGSNVELYVCEVRMKKIQEVPRKPNFAPINFWMKLLHFEPTLNVKKLTFTQRARRLKLCG